MASSVSFENGATTSSKNRLLATGFNAHRQLSSDTKSDILSFIPVCETSASDLRVIFAGWSQTFVVANGGSLLLGHDQNEVKNFLPKGEEALKSAIGNVNGLLLTLDSSGRVSLVGPEMNGDDEDPRLGHIALAQNGRVALTFMQTPSSQLCHVMEFRSYERFRNWSKNPSGEGNYPDGHYMLAGRPKQLVANTGTFVMLMEGGEVHTWGDARYKSLGRSISGEDAAPADQPGSVEALGGLKIAKIAAGGWISAALAEDGSLYVWGTTSPGSKVKIKALHDDDGGEIVLVQVACDASGAPLDVLDVGVGDDHIAVVAEGHRLFVVGENRNGQLGLSNDVASEEWREILQPGGFRAVWCGPLSTFALVHTT